MEVKLGSRAYITFGGKYCGFIVQRKETFPGVSAKGCYLLSLCNST